MMVPSYHLVSAGGAEDERRHHIALGPGKRQAVRAERHKVRSETCVIATVLGNSVERTL